MDLKSVAVLEAKMRSAIEAYDEISKVSSSFSNDSYYSEFKKNVTGKLIDVFNLVGDLKGRLDKAYSYCGLNKEVSPGIRAFNAIQNHIRYPEGRKESYNEGFSELYRRNGNDESITTFYNEINRQKKYSLNEISSQNTNNYYYESSTNEPDLTYKPSSFDTLEKDSFSVESLGGGRRHL